MKRSNIHRICLRIVLSMDNSTPDNSDEGSYLQEAMSQAPYLLLQPSQFVFLRPEQTRYRPNAGFRRLRFPSQRSAIVYHSRRSTSCAIFTPMSAYLESPGQKLYTLSEEELLRFKFRGVRC